MCVDAGLSKCLWQEARLDRPNATGRLGIRAGSMLLQVNPVPMLTIDCAMITAATDQHS